MLIRYKLGPTERKSKWLENSGQITRRTVCFTTPRRFNAEKGWKHHLETIRPGLDETADQQKSVLKSVVTAYLFHDIINSDTHDFVL